MPIPLALGTILVSAVGTAIGTYFQDRSNDHQVSVQMRQKQLQSASAFFDQYTVDQSRFLFSMRKLKWALDDCDPSKEADLAVLHEHWETFIEQYDNWFINLSINSSKIEMYFGKATLEKFIRVHGLLKPLGYVTWQLFKLKTNGESGSNPDATTLNEAQSYEQAKEFPEYMQYNENYAAAGWEMTSLTRTMLADLNAESVGTFNEGTSPHAPVGMDKAAHQVKIQTSKVEAPVQTLEAEEVKTKAEPPTEIQQAETKVEEKQTRSQSAAQTSTTLPKTKAKKPTTRSTSRKKPPATRKSTSAKKTSSKGAKSGESETPAGE